KQYINTLDVSKGKKENALRALNNIAQYNRHVSVLDSNEKEVLARVWGRTNASGNENNSKLMKEAVVNALSECVEHNNVVCANGVVSRLLESPVTLDKDKTVGNINTLENVKNMIFDKAHILIEREIER